MFLPRFDYDVLNDRMQEVWLQAEFLWITNRHVGWVEKMNEYRYLSGWLADSVAMSYA